MCGIIGAFDGRVRGQVPLSDEDVRAAVRLLRHRGPDDQGVERISVSEGHLVFGHARLSIIDLSAGGHQPRFSADRRLCLVFNGEIYNYRELRNELSGLGHRFQTDSDTEVLLACWIQWGQACLHRLVGMFAFAVHNSAEGSLTLVRDAFGIKPLYYFADSGRFGFASELSALERIMERRPDVDAQSAFEYLTLGTYDSGTRTFLDGVSQLKPGHLLTVRLSSRPIAVDSERWWWPSIEEQSSVSFAEAAESVRGMFLDNVRLHLRSDVPIGAALSGGVDSSAVVCAMRQIEPDLPINTFTFVASGSEVDEEHWADVVNDHVGALSHKVVVRPDELSTDLDDIIRSQGEPFGSTSIYAQYRVFQLARESEVTVTLDGQGADELLAGYAGYPDARLHSLFERGQLGEVLPFLQQWSRWPGRGSRRAAYLLGVATLPKPVRELVLVAAGRRKPPVWLSRDWVRAHGLSKVEAAAVPLSSEGRGRRLVERLRDALTGNGLAALLRHGDRNSMRWSVESRVPFLTPQLAEYLLRLPESFLLSNTGETKSVFRAAMRGIVPDAILDRRDKIGFQTPERDWLRHQRREVLQWLEAAKDIPILDAATATGSVTDILDGRQPFSPHVWRLVNLCRWWQIR